MQQNELREFEGKCIQEEAPACESRCPLHVDARGLARLMAGGNFSEARKLLDRVMPLSSILAFLCEGPCMGGCRRAEVDSPVNLPLLERACLLNSRGLKPMPLPASGKSAAVLGSGLSSLTAAYELGKKGHSVLILHAGSPGGELLGLAPEVLPPEMLEAAFEQLAGLRARFTRLDAFSSALPQELLGEHSGVYCGFDDARLASLLPRPSFVHPVTLEAGLPGLFAGGWESSFIGKAASGRRAALSLDRFFQGVDPATAREKEGPQPSRLYTDISSVQPVPAVRPVSAFHPSVEEAAAEGGRCIQCECMECVKRCAYLARYEGYPKKYARRIYNNLATIAGIRQANKQINSCARCGLCAKICPHGADMGVFCATARGEMVKTRHMPVSAHDFALLEFEYSNSPEVAFYRKDPEGESVRPDEWLFFPGCRLPASMPRQTEELYRHLRRHLSGGVGLAYRCCGAPASWSGREALADETARVFLKLWEEAGGPVVLAACASCLEFFRVNLPHIPVRPVWELMSTLPLPEGARAAPFALALHDPCAAREDRAAQESVRALLAALGQNLEELPLGGALTRCCGFGGLASAADPDMGLAYAQSRAGDTGNPILAYCAMCRELLRAGGKETLHILDLLFPGGEGVFMEAARRPALGISDRQEAQSDFSRKMLRELWREEEENGMPDKELLIDPEMERKLEERRIRRSDLQTVLRRAEDEGALFANPSNGRFLAGLRPRQVSFWVEFSRSENGAYVIHDAYCHRMVVPGVPGEGASTPASREGSAEKAVWG